MANRVIAVAEQMGYVPNGLATSLRTRRSETVGVVLPDITNPVFPPILEGLEAGLAEHGYIAMVANAGHEPARQRLVVERLLARQVDGLILATVTRHDSIIDLCLKTNVPVVVVNRHELDHRASSVVSDDARGMQLAVDHLVACGHKHIAHIAGPQQLSTGRGRLEGFLAAMARAPAGEPAAPERAGRAIHPRCRARGQPDAAGPGAGDHRHRRRQRSAGTRRL